METNNILAVIILNYLTWEDTLAEADIVHNICGIPYGNIYIIDNASPNESKDELISHNDKGYRLICSDVNKGYAAGNNVGLRQALHDGYKFGWVLNNDVIIEDPDFANKILKVFEKDPNIAVVNSDIYSPDGHLFNRDAERPSFFDMTIGMMRYKKRGRSTIDLGGYSYVYRPQGCSMILDLQKLKQIDWFDEHTFLYCEEPILAERLIKLGYKVACCTETSCIHNHSTTVKNTLQKKKVRKIISESFTYYLREYRKFNKIQVFVANAFNQIKYRILGN
ncbi:MAG: glycosyltransferase family 2 protein [Lachnospiraceae bacterium]|nr:MAG: glycosyltransferase family 2 protein [Lachnospiraceae bacterium]